MDNRTKLLESAFENIGHAVVMYDCDRKLVLWNSLYEQTLAYPSGFLKEGLWHFDIILFLAERGDFGEGDPQQIAHERIEPLWSQPPTNTEISLPNQHIYEIRYLPTDDGGLIISYTDITERKQAEAEVSRNRVLFKSILDHSPLAITLKDRNLKQLIVNETYGQWFGYPVKEMIGKHFADYTVPEQVDFFAAMDNQVLETRQPAEPQEYRDEKPFRAPMDIVVNKFPVIDPDGTLIGIGTIQSDITDRKKAEEELIHMANHDPLTGLATRRLGMEEIHLILAQAKRDNKKAAVLFIDLDGFKTINDTLGHVAGDQLLIEVAGRLKQCVREVDIVARLGGDEFMVVLSGVENRKNIASVTQNLVETLARPYTLGGENIIIGASIGIAIYPDQEQSPDKLLQLADVAMYKVKGAGKNNFAFSEDT